MTKLDILGNPAKIVYLAIGSNLGNRFLNINKAKSKLINKGILIRKCSSNYESLSWPNKKNPKFINIVIQIKTTLSCLELLDICQTIEKELGRLKKSKNSPRTCDIDIIDYDRKLIRINDPKALFLPHKSMSKRNFVLLPLFEIAKSWKHPETNINITQLISCLKIKDLRAINQI